MADVVSRICRATSLSTASSRLREHGLGPQPITPGQGTDTEQSVAALNGVGRSPTSHVTHDGTERDQQAMI